MFSDCSGPCYTCTAFGGGCLAGHGDDCYQRISKDEAARRVKLRRTDGGKHYDGAELAILSIIAGVVCPPVLPDRVMVAVTDLRVVANTGCEHVIRGAQSCDEADEMRGGCCNSCWAARWAKSVLEKEGLNV